MTYRYNVQSGSILVSGLTETWEFGIQNPQITSVTYRDPTQQPFASDTIANIGIGSGAQWSDVNTDYATQVLSSASMSINTSTWSFPCYVGSASDPLITITQTTPGDYWPMTTKQVHVPVGAVCDSSTDTSIVFFDSSNKYVYYYYGVSYNNGVNCDGGIDTSFGGVYDVTGDGWMTPYGSVPASPGDSGYVFSSSNNGGWGNSNHGLFMIRTSDMNNGAIKHMIRSALDPSMLRYAINTGNLNYDCTHGLPWPTRHCDYGDNWPGPITYGLTFGIPKSVNLSGLGLSTGGMILATCLQNYGSIIHDQGSGGVIFYAENDIVNHSTANNLIVQAQNDGAKIVPHLRILTNQGPSTVNGGGTYLPLQPPIDPRVTGGTLGTGSMTVITKTSYAAHLVNVRAITDTGSVSFTVAVNGTTVTALGTISAGTGGTVKTASYAIPSGAEITIAILTMSGPPSRLSLTFTVTRD